MVTLAKVRQHRRCYPSTYAQAVPNQAAESRAADKDSLLSKLADLLRIFQAYHQMLAHSKLEPDFSISTLARRADGLSGSDLKETCRNAAMAPVRELMREKGKTGKEGLEEARKDVSVSSRGMRCLLIDRASKFDR